MSNPTAAGDDRLEALQADIDAQRAELAEAEGKGDEPRFIDRGDVGEEVVDDTIAPPG